MKVRDALLKQKLYFVALDDMINFLNLWSTFGNRRMYKIPKLKGIPEDGVVTRIFFDPTRNGIGFIVASESFEEVEPGQIPPIISTEFEVITLDAREPD